MENVLFYGGIVLMAAAAAGAVITAIALRVSGKRLQEKLDVEFGKKRR